MGRHRCFGKREVTLVGGRAAVGGALTFLCDWCRLSSQCHHYNVGAVIVVMNNWWLSGGNSVSLHSMTPTVDNEHFCQSDKSKWFSNTSITCLFRFLRLITFIISPNLRISDHLKGYRCNHFTFLCYRWRDFYQFIYIYWSPFLHFFANKIKSIKSLKLRMAVSCCISLLLISAACLRE